MRRAIRQRVKETGTVMNLHQLREARSLTQVNLAKVLNVNQGAVSKMEKRTDMYLSTCAAISKRWVVIFKSRQYSLKVEVHRLRAV